MAYSATATADALCSRRWSDRNGHSWPTLRRWIREPSQKPIERPTVHDSVGRNTRETRMCESGLGIRELPGRVRVTVKREQAASRQRIARQHVIEILPGGIAIDFYRHASVSRGGKHRGPIGDHTRARACNTTARVRQNSNHRVPDGGEHTLGLIFTPSQTRMRRR
jgi:hypothetical protein